MSCGVLRVLWHLNYALAANATAAIDATGMFKCM